MRLEHLYRLTFQYTDSWSAELVPGQTESENLFIADGRCEGAITGSFRAVNAPHRRADGTFLPDLHGVIETADGAEILTRMTGYGRAYPVGRRQIVAVATHTSEHADHRRLNDAVCPCAGEVRTLGDDTELVIDVAELVWEPLAD